MKSKALVFVFAFLIGIVSCTSDAGHDDHLEKGTQVYTCPMHPDIIRNEPGQCPVCGMKLVAKPEDGENLTDTSLSDLLKPTNEYVFSEVKTISPQIMSFPLEINATGTITYDTREQNTVSARVSGWIEKLYVTYQYQKVNKGDKLMDIYSKELVTEQENYLHLLKNDAENEQIIKATEKRLLLMGLQSEQIADLKKGKKTLHAVTIYSPYSGHLHDLSINLSLSKTGENMGMNESSSTELVLKEGAYVKAGQTVFNIYGTNKVWAVLDINPENFGLLKIGQPVSISGTGDQKELITGKVDFIEPALREGSKTISLRVYLENTKNELKIGQLIKAKIDAGAKKGSFIPTTAIVHLGHKEIVFVKGPRYFKPKTIVTGLTWNGNTEVVSGIETQEQIAENAQMLVDSESFIK